MPRPKKYIGVTRNPTDRHRNHWKAQIRVEHRVVGWPVRFAKCEDAARLYDVMAICLRGPAARLNFDGQPPVGVLVCDVEQFLSDQGVLPKTYQRGNVAKISCKVPLI